jgi:uncharacterized protein YabN with tetrapyrrole methylase and pyrophosphatase domain
VGTGIHFPGHLTAAAREEIERADRVLYVVDNPGTSSWLQEAAPGAEDLRAVVEGTPGPRLKVYDAMTERILRDVRSGFRVCAVFYGHPGMFSYPGHEAVRRARNEGFRAEILPAISAVDCLFADLAIDPAANGFRVFDATDFLIHGRVLDLSCELVLLQIAMVGDPQYRSYAAPGMPVLTATLEAGYGSDHGVVLYEAATRQGETPSIRSLPLSRLSKERMSAFTTLYVPAKTTSPADLNMMIRLARARS